MIVFILVGLVAVILLLQFRVAPEASQHLTLRHTFDTQLAEPGEPIAFASTLANDWWLPVLFINFYEYMPEGAALVGKDGNCESHSLFLLPRRSFSHSTLFTLPKRGVYRSGRYYIQTGDFLGFKSWIASGNISCNITVMPKLCEDEPVLRILGGYIGDISVRRFIMEDPVLTLGTREYTGQEPMKKISWKHSAQVGELIVHNNDYTVDANAAVVLNMARGTEEEKEKSFEIVRTVCERLERERIPYQFLSNGDAGNLEEGFGKMHVEQLMTNLGRSRLNDYASFDSLIERCIRERKRSRSYFIISPPLSAEDRDALARLQRYSEYELCVLEAEVNRDARG